MDITPLKLELADLSKNEESFRTLHADFRRYVDDLVAILKGDFRPIVPRREALRLKLHDHSQYLSEWRDGERHLHSDIFGLVEQSANYDSLSEIARALIRADAKFEHEILRREDARKSLELKIAILQDTDPLTVTREGVFVAGQTFDAFRRIQQIMRTAKNSIAIIDGYVDETVLDVVAGLGVSVEILTFSVSGALKAAAAKFQSQYGNLSIRTLSTFHDRFIIIDDADFYHFGASLKDAAKKGFMFSRIEEPAVIGTLRTEWQKEWDRAAKVF